MRSPPNCGQQSDSCLQVLSEAAKRLAGTGPGAKLFSKLTA